MAKTYTVAFGSGDPRSFTGLSPTLLIFVNASSGTTLVAPAFSEALTGSGIYKFSYGTTTPIAFLADAATTSPGSVGRYVIGQIDPADRIDEVGTTLVAIGTSNIALGTTSVALGVTNVALGTTNIGYGVSNFALGTSIYTFDQAFGSSFAAFGASITALGTSILAGVGSGASIEILIGTTASAIGDSSTNPSDLFGYLKRINESILGQETFNKGSGAFIILDRTGATTLASRTITNNASMVIKS